MIASEFPIINYKLENRLLKKIIFKVKLEIYNGRAEKVVEIAPKIKVKEKELLSETRPTTCKYCGAEVFFYQNEYGSKVFFYLRIPWTKHECEEYLNFKEKSRK